MNRSMRSSDLPRLLFVVGFGAACAMGVEPVHAQGLCGGIDYPFPYTDVSAVGSAFCPGIMEAYVTGISKGTTPTTFSPNNDVIRVQMTTILQRTVDQVLTRGSRRAALQQWWTPRNSYSTQEVIVGGGQIVGCAGDGADIWTTSATVGSVTQVQANTGVVLGTWTGAFAPVGVLAAAGKVYVAGAGSPGHLYVIDPTQAPGTITTAASNLGDNPYGIAFDGTSLWTANRGGSVSIITLPSFSVTTVSTGFTAPYGILYDGSNIWVADGGADALLKLDPSGAILQSVPTGSGPSFPTFDGANIWVPNEVDSSITVVQASTGTVVATISANGTNLLNNPNGLAFDGERIMAANFGTGSVSLFKAADLSFIANVPVGSTPFSACSDGVNFWIPLFNAGTLVRF